MQDVVVVSVSRKTRPSETLLRRLTAALSVLFLLQAVLFSTAFMLPCFLSALFYYWYGHASKREYEYTLEDRFLKIDRVSDRGRVRLYEIPADQIFLVCAPDAPEALPYRKNGSVKVKKEDYTSYRRRRCGSSGAGTGRPSGRRSPPDGRRPGRLVNV